MCCGKRPRFRAYMRVVDPVPPATSKKIEVWANGAWHNVTYVSATWNRKHLSRQMLNDAMKVAKLYDSRVNEITWGNPPFESKMK